MKKEKTNKIENKKETKKIIKKTSSLLPSEKIINRIKWDYNLKNYFNNFIIYYLDRFLGEQTKV
jgi:hypothetical protein